MTYAVVSRGRAGYPALLKELYDPPARLYLRGGPADLLDLPTVAIVGARSCSAYGAQVARELARELGAAGARDRQRAGPRRGRRGASRRSRRGRPDGRRPRLRDRPRLPAGPCLARRPHRTERSDRLRVPTRNRALPVALPGAESHRRRSRPGDGRGRSPRALRRADHGRLRPRARPGGVRCSR